MLNVVYRNVLSFCLKPDQNLVCLAEAFLCLVSLVSPRLFKICISTNLHQNQSQKQQPLTLLSVFLSSSVVLPLCNTCILIPFKGCRTSDLTSYFFSNILPYETHNRPKLSKYSTLPLIKGCAKKRLKPIREKKHFLSCILIAWAVIWAAKLWAKNSSFFFFLLDVKKKQLPSLTLHRTLIAFNLLSI